MSWSIELSLINELGPWPISKNTLPYTAGWMSPHDQPEWMVQRHSQQDFQTLYELWDVYSEEVILRLPSACRSRQGESAWLFCGPILEIGSLLDHLPPKAHQRIQQLAQNKNGWDEETLRSSFKNLQNQFKQWLIALGPGQIGLMRIYEWGKF